MTSTAGVERRWLLVLTGGCLAAALFFLALPRLVASMALLAADSGFDLFRSGDQPTVAGIERVIEAQTTAIWWLPVASTPHVGLGQVLMTLAANVGSTEIDRQALLDEAERQLRLGLTLAPADAMAWSQLATVLAVEGRADEAATALAMSFTADPHTTQLQTTRTSLGMTLWDRLDEGLRGLLKRELQTFYRLDPQAVMRTALRARTLPILREALVNDPQDSQSLAIYLDDYWAGGA